MTLKAWVQNRPDLKRRLKPLVRLVRPLIPQIGLGGIAHYFRFIGDWRRFKAAGGQISLSEAFPMIYDRTSTTEIDAHYFYQAIWAFRHIKDSAPAKHVDVGSQAIFVGLLTTVTDVEFVDIRPLGVILPRYQERRGTILELPYEDRSVQSISCMHVLEHIGLGRYGDPLDPEGTAKACQELQRVLGPGGRLYVSMPVGRKRIEFNAHRVHAPTDPLSLFPELKLETFATVDDKGTFREGEDPSRVPEMEYGLGMYVFAR